MLNKAIFLDRDGVINKLLTNHEDRHDPSNYVINWDQFEFCDGALDALKMAKEKLSDFFIFVVSNQSGIERGLVDYSTVDDIFRDMRLEVVKTGGHIQEHYICWHTPDTGCWCRKPRPGLLYYAAIAWDLDLSQCWMIGDSVSDMGAAEGACIPVERRIYICTEYNEPVAPSIAGFNVFGLYYAVELIEAHERSKT